MRIFTPRKEPVTVTLLIPLPLPEDAPRGTPVEYREELRKFLVREKLRPEAAEWAAFLGKFSGSDIDEADELLRDMLQHILAHPMNGEAALKREEVDFIPDEEKIDLIDFQGEIYGFRSEDQRLGKKFRPVIERLSQLKIASSAVTMARGLRCAPSLPAPGESTQTSQSENGPTENSNTTGVSPTETAGEPENSTDS